MATVTQPVITDDTGLEISDALDEIAEAIAGRRGSVLATYDETPALYAHAVNDLIYFDDHFYTVTQAIAVGNTIAAGTNIALATLRISTPVYVKNLPGGRELDPSVIYPSVDSVTLTYANPTATVTLQIVGDGQLSVSNSNTSVCTASLSGTTVTINRISQAAATATVTVSISNGAAYAASSTQITVTNAAAAVQWSTGTDTEIIEMIALADQGTIDLHDDLGWSVGDERSVSLSAMEATGVGESHVAQTATLVLLHQGGYQLSSGQTCKFVVGLKNGLLEKGYMNSSNTNSGSWKSSARRAWCNNVFYNAIPETLRPAFKQFKTLTAATYNGTTNEYTTDYFALPAAAEVFKGDPTYGTGGSAGKTTGYSNLTEFDALFQFTYYATAANRIKTTGDGGSADRWWERSPVYDIASDFCGVSSSGGAGNYGASSAWLLSPFGCI